jgi:hypothetical protein
MVMARVCPATLRLANGSGFLGLSLVLALGCSVDDRPLKLIAVDSGVDGSHDVAGSTSGCTMSNTRVASSDGVIASFMDESGLNFFTFGSPDALMFTAADGALNLTENHAAVPYAQYDGIGLGFTECVDATSFAGVEFTISGSMSGCTMQYSTSFTEDDVNDGTANSDPRGSCQRSEFSSCYSPQISIIPAPVATTIKAPWANPSFYVLGSPVLSPNDPGRLVGVQWQFTIAPAPDGGSDTCVADVTITNLAFYR